MRDEVLASSLRTIYLDPLAEERDGGAALRETLTAYFAAHHHVSATAASLGIARQTVSNRLRTIEERIGRSIDAHAAEMKIALGLATLPVR
jgi:DNA-binding PucR family transcriptional regulator